MRRQEAYNGVLAWNLNAIINALPIVMIISLRLACLRSLLGGFFLSLSSNFGSIRYSAFVNQKWISLAVGASGSAQTVGRTRIERRRI